MKTEHIDDALVCRAGKGEWYNQPHNRRWDMGEDVADIPAAAWHLELQRAIEAQEVPPELVVVDVSEMAGLVGQDWGFLIRVQKSIEPNGIGLAIVASAGIANEARLLGLQDRLKICDSIDNLSITD